MGKSRVPEHGEGIERLVCRRTTNFEYLNQLLDVGSLQSHLLEYKQHSIPYNLMFNIISTISQ